ncbi:two-component system, transcriptional regulatory protein [Flavobacterium limnosediminis JC2902]|uniref:Two-component system, transcriptional regulatory protein n=1 Tax=Flavobacterium limnosediminis JC2902 TaxID=1341181 RepID=V6SKP5_9FLAO|nr:two-component system, transcriptional regulatory protein [Flavobacterium limnosediminis JC2902]
MKKILLAEDDTDFALVLKQYLELYGYTVVWAKDGEEALQMFQNEAFSICIFDVMMPKIDGFTLAEKIIKVNPETPFIFLTAKKMKEDKIKGLKLGADDYIVKPFEADELVLRINNILKRTGKNDVSISEKIKIGSYLFDTLRFELHFNTEIQRVTEKEAALLLFLFQNKNRLLKREEILKSLWGTDDFFSGRSMDVYISKLRKYLCNDANISIESIRNIGLELKIKNADL